MLRPLITTILGQRLRSPVTATGLRRMYHERVVDHYDNPRNVGSFDKNDPNVGTGLVGAPACGDVMKLQIRVDEESGKIVDACFKTFGCGSAIASSSVGFMLEKFNAVSSDSNKIFATEWVKGKQMEEVLSIKNTEIAKHLSLPPVKLHCSMLAEDAIKAAVKDYEAKRTKSSGSQEAVPVGKAADA
ncbi:iron-sulfur cluster assembly protein 1 [Phtheirospermum japonicum]|uniref:Iron-sulfur cluster assembly protein 1 n=1 Tax=Phtheirospermum japonicum TaxID=374723 RepID=A0A830B4K1_9LAMI|nr:iron-sulfur cluster assembly protein 1 [Phtheirospermum japonicum]